MAAFACACEDNSQIAKSLLCLMLIKYDNLGGTENFLPAFLHSNEIYSLKI